MSWGPGVSSSSVVDINILLLHLRFFTCLDCSTGRKINRFFSNFTRSLRILWIMQLRISIWPPSVLCIKSSFCLKTAAYHHPLLWPACRMTLYSTLGKSHGFNRFNLETCFKTPCEAYHYMHTTFVPVLNIKCLLLTDRVQQLLFGDWHTVYYQ
jgi:hypothetical protein